MEALKALSDVTFVFEQAEHIAVSQIVAFDRDGSMIAYGWPAPASHS